MLLRYSEFVPPCTTNVQQNNKHYHNRPICKYLVSLYKSQYTYTIGDTMDIYTVVAFVVGVIIVTAFFLIKDKKLIDADKAASQIIAILGAVLDKYGDVVKAYDKENGTDYFETVTKMLADVRAMEADDQITPVEFALNVIAMYEDLKAILENVNLYDKVVTTEIKV